MLKNNPVGAEYYHICRQNCSLILRGYCTCTYSNFDDCSIAFDRMPCVYLSYTDSQELTLRIMVVWPFAFPDLKRF